MMRKHTASFKPRLEILEDRLCPSSYSVIDLPGLGGTTAISDAFGINDSSVVVGDATNATSGNGFIHAVEWQADATGKVMTTALPEVVSRSSRANDINRVGQVVGYSDTTLNGPDPATPNTPHAALWQANAAGTFAVTDLGGLPNYPYTEADGINNPGQVVGSGDNSNFQHTAFLWDSANGMRDLNTLLPAGSGWQLTGASEINDNGQIVGTGLHGGTSRGFRFDLGTSTIIDLGSLPGGTASGANAVNSLGGVAGSAETGHMNRYNRMNSDAVLYQNGTLTDLGSLGDAGSTGLGVNDAGVVVGRYFKTNHSPSNNTSSYDSYAFIWQNGTMTDLGQLLPKNAKWRLFSASDLNSTGCIVGNGNINSQSHAFLAIPPGITLTSLTAAAGTSLTTAPTAGATTSTQVGLPATPPTGIWFASGAVSPTQPAAVNPTPDAEVLAAVPSDGPSLRAGSLDTGRQDELALAFARTSAGIPAAALDPLWADFPDGGF